MSKAAGAQRDGHTPTHTYRPHKTGVHSFIRRANKQEEGSFTQRMNEKHFQRWTYRDLLYHGASWSHIRERGFVHFLGISRLPNESLYRNIGLDLINHTSMWFSVPTEMETRLIICSCWHTCVHYKTAGWMTLFGWSGWKVRTFYMRKPWYDIPGWA